MENGIVIPCYNEADRLQFELFADFINSHADYVLCFVNDGSKDHTLQLLNDFQQQHPERVAVYDMPQNGGKAEAVRAGILHLVQRHHVQTVGFMDADLSTSFEDYMGLTQSLKANYQKMVFGSRKLLENENIERTLFRSLASKVVGVLVHSILRLPIHDTQCGAKVFTADLAASCFRESFVTRWLFDVELFIRAKRQYGHKEVMNRITEQPLSGWMDVEGSKLTLKDSLMIPAQLWKIFFSYDLRPALSATPRRVSRWSYRAMSSLGIF